MIELKSITEEESEALTTRINTILDAALPPLRAEIDPSVRINAVAMQLAIVMKTVYPDQREAFFAIFAKLLWVHLESLEKHMAEIAVNRLLSFMKAVFAEKGPGNDTNQ